jgi:hypothetical protein
MLVSWQRKQVGREYMFPYPFRGLHDHRNASTSTHMEGPAGGDYVVCVGQQYRPFARC